MAIIVQCPSCGVSSPAAESFSGRSVRCKKCGNPFVAHPTLDGSRSDTRKSPPVEAGNPFPQLPAEFGRYRVLRLLGKGGMGAVYLAKDSQLGREVALKIPFFDAKESPQRAERFVREARSAAALHHPNICTVFDAGRISGTPFLTMGFVKGTPLDQAIDPESPMPQVRAAEIARKVALGMAHAHGKGIVHRDLKPANVILAEDGEPVVMDFGLAKRGVGVDPSEAKLTHDGGIFPNEVKLTRDGGVLGTPSYMSPEQVRGDAADIGPQTDVYSLGVLLFEMITGKTPYSGGMSAVMGQILAAPVPPLAESRPDADPRLDAICRTAMAKSPGSRFPSMAAFAQALGVYLTEESEGSAISVELVEPAAPQWPAPAAVVPTLVYQTAPAPLATPFDELTDEGPPVQRPAKKKATLAKGGWGGRRIGIAAGVALAVIVPLVWLAGYLLRVETPNGTLLVEIADAEVEAKIKGGKLVLSGPDGKPRYTLSAGERDKKLEAGAYTIRVEGADGLVLSTPEFTLKKGGKVTVRVTVEKKDVAKKEEPKKEPPQVVEPDRTAAKYVLSIGGIARINGGEQNIRGAADLPDEPFVLTYAHLHLTPATDKGLAAFRGCKGLMYLHLGAVPVSDEGLENFKDCDRLELLCLGGTRVTDDGLAHFVGCRQLRQLWLDSTAVTDAGVARLKGCTKLQNVVVYSTSISDASVIQFAESKDLESIDLTRTRVSDAGLKALAECPKLAMAALKVTNVTAVGVASFKKSLPNCVVHTDAVATVAPPAAPKDEAFVPLFNGKDLTGWKSYGKPTWVWAGGELVGKPAPDKTSGFLMSEASYTDCEIELEYKASAGIGSGLFLRSDPNGPVSGAEQFEIQIMDDSFPAFQATPYKTGSVFGAFGRKADPKIMNGNWIALRVKLSGRKVEVWVNDTQTIDANLDNARPQFGKFPGLVRVSGRIGLQQNQNADVQFRNMRVKKLDGTDQVGAVPAKGFTSLFNGKDLTGWAVDSGPAERWKVEGGYIKGTGAGSGTRGWLLSEKGYDNFALNLEFKVAPEADGGIGIYALPGDKVGITPHHLAVKLTGNSKPTTPQIGALYYWPNMWLSPSKPATLVAAGGWNKLAVRVVGGEVRVSVNGEEVQKLNLSDIALKQNVFPAAKRTSGRIGLQQHTGEVSYRNIEIQELPAEKPAATPDPFPEKSVWRSDNGGMVLTVNERKGDTFRARFVGAGIDRDVSGTVRNGKVSWLAKDVKAIKGVPGHDNEGTLGRDKEGDVIDFVYRNPGTATVAGAFNLHRKPGS